VNLFQGAAIHEFGFRSRDAFNLRREMPVDEVPRDDEAIQFRFQPLHREGVPRADRVQRHRAGVGEETFQNSAGGVTLG